ncbi:uncharacterized protein LOC135848662 isoform X2 [Planococcus citri]|uniref:uncharacterized protein LOC135848662 isoform X2 n=1 Tax=Planococcus citri TaxID=170843 RepID=UPI0031F76D56
MISCQLSASASSVNMSRVSLTRPSSRTRIRKISRTESECSERNEECTRLTGMTDSTGAMDAGLSPPQEEDTYSYCEYHDLPPPPDGGYGWVIVFASFMCNMIVDGIAYTFGIFIGDLVDKFGEGRGKVAWIGSLLSGMYLSAGPVVSAFSNKFGCRAACICGSIIGTVAFILSIFSKNSTVMMITYGFMGGIGFGFIYLPAVVAVSYYFETKRSLATGIAVCGSGFGTFAFAPLATYLLENYGWQGANIILAGLILNCAVFGALMRPLEYPKESNCKPLLQRMADEKRLQMERGSIGGSYFIVQMPDGSMEKRMKLPLNIDPGVHSSFNLDQLVPGTPITPVPTMAVLPTITEVKVPEHSGSSNNSSSGGSANDVKIEKGKKKKDTIKEEAESQKNSKVDLNEKKDDDQEQNDEDEKSPTSDGKSEKEDDDAKTSNKNIAAGGKDVEKSPDIRVTMLPRNQSQPAFTTHVQGIPKNGSVPFFDRIRKTSASERFRPSLGPIKVSRPNVNSNGDVRKSVHLRLSNASIVGSKNNNAEDMWSKTDMDAESVRFATSRGSIIQRKEKSEMVRPMSRKDIFYSGSVMNLPEYQSQKSLQSYRQSIMSIPKYSRERLTSENADTEKGSSEDCSCGLSESFKSVLASMLDMSLLRDPVFMLIGVSNIFGMAGLYVPFVYLVEAAKMENISANQASFLISIIGITNTFGRVICGYIADLPWVDSLFLNNICLLVSSISVAATPFCHTYAQFIIMAIFFGIAVSGYISLTSIILVDLLGLDKLTNAFGLLILFRGAAAIVGSPLAGAVYDATKSYTVPFLMAGGFFFISAITSFMAPAMKQCVTPETRPPILDILTPIDEDDEEEEDDEIGDNNGMVIPEIVETTPSPVLHKAPPHQEIKQIESVL